MPVTPARRATTASTRTVLTPVPKVACVREAQASTWRCVQVERTATWSCSWTRLSAKRVMLGRTVTLLVWRQSADHAVPATIASRAWTLLLLAEPTLVLEVRVVDPGGVMTCRTVLFRGGSKQKFSVRHQLLQKVVWNWVSWGMWNAHELYKCCMWCEGISGDLRGFGAFAISYLKFGARVMIGKKLDFTLSRSLSLSCSLSLLFYEKWLYYYCLKQKYLRLKE